MKILSRVCLLVLPLSFSVTAARADSISFDGRIIVGHGSDPGGPDSCGLDFKIHLNGKGGGIKNCQNTSGVDWVGLELLANIPLGDTVTCVTMSPSIFDNCNTEILSTSGQKEKVEIVLSGGLIPAGSLFFINLNTSGSSDPNGAGGWVEFEGGNLNAKAITATPEPSSVGLLASGISLFYLRRKKKSQKLLA